METQRLSYKWLFELHSLEQIRRWVLSLEYFYFKRAWGGHANDGDEFKLILRYEDKRDLLDILKRLDIQLVSLPEGHPKPIPVDNHKQGTFSIFKSQINDFPEYEQPNYISLKGINCFCWIENGNISFTLSGGQDGDLYEVTETDFENCKKLERLIIDSDLTNHVSRDFENSVTCISRTRYPDLFVNHDK